MAATLNRELGFVTPSAEDWTLSQAAFPLSINFAILGVAAALLGGW